MFGMGGTEILVILIVALLFLGPDKLPEAAKKISKGIRDIKQQSRILQRTIEDDEHIGGAIRDLKSALRGEEEPVRPKPIKPPKQLVEPAAPALPEAGSPEHAAAAIAGALAADSPEHGAAPIAGTIVADSPALGAPEPTLRGVAAPVGSADPGDTGSADRASAGPAEHNASSHDHNASSHDHNASSHDHNASSHDHNASSHDHNASSHDHNASSHEPTLRGVLAPTAPGEPPKLTMPPVAGERDGAAPPSAADDAALAALVKPAPHTIARSSPSVAATSPAAAPPPVAPEAEPTRSTGSTDKSEPEHG